MDSSGGAGFATYPRLDHSEDVAIWRQGRAATYALVPPATGMAMQRGDFGALRASDEIQAQVPRSRRARIRQAFDECTNTEHYRIKPDVAWLNYGYNWNLNVNDFGNNAATNQAMINAHVAWDNETNECGIADYQVLTSHYAGATAARPLRGDGLSVIGKGTAAEFEANCMSPSALACTWNTHPNDSPWLSESDQWYNVAYTWTNSPQTTQNWDYQSIATHETGHTIGLDHAYTSEYLTMYPSARIGTDDWRRIGYGDILGGREVYLHP